MPIALAGWLLPSPQSYSSMAYRRGQEGRRCKGGKGGIEWVNNEKWKEKKKKRERAMRKNSTKEQKGKER